MARRWITLLLLVLTLASCGEDGEDRGASPATTSTAPTTAAPAPSTSTAALAPTTSTTARPVDYHRPSAAREAARGLLEGTSLDGSALYVTAVDPALSKPGCEGQPEPVLFRVPLAGGPRQAVGTPGEPVRGTILRGGADRRVALVAGCEEFLTDVRIGTESPEGQLRDLRQLDRKQLGPSPSLAWSSDGRRLVAIARSDAPAGQSSIVRVDPTTGGATPLFTVNGPLTQIGQLADGTFVLAGAGRVTLRDSAGTVKETVDGVGFTVSPDGRRLAIWGKALRLLTPGQPATTLAPVAATDLNGPAQFSPDGAAVAYATSVGQDGQVAVVTVADGKVTTVPGTGRFVRAFFTGDGRALAFSRLAARPAEEPIVFVVRFDG